MSAIRVLAVDGHAVVRHGLRAILAAHEGMEVVGEAADGFDATRLAAKLVPDVIVFDVSALGMTGPELTTRLCAASHSVLALTACEDETALRLLLTAGARGYVLKRSPVDALVRAIQTVAEGGHYHDPCVSAQTGGGTSGPERVGVELSERECEVIRLIAHGYSNKDIAARLRVSVKTVETYKSRSMEKLRIRSRVDIVRFVAHRGWLAPDPLPDTGAPAQEAGRPTVAGA
ncbi:MAG TPA: response regulator transcription factor [Urbifossiella sp.]|jgi:DNA-binding NarL/FixJ family response regulator|nr:response regulator transcription factor [Urbifossiella sp.]